MNRNSVWDQQEASTSLSIGARVRALRQRLGLTQEQFAHEIAVTASTVNRWENEHSAPSRLARKVMQDLATSVA